MKKLRLDTLLCERGLAESRTKAQALIMAGKVRLDGQIVSKAGMPVQAKANVTVDENLPYVSRGGLKLVAALDGFQVDPQDFVCADVGASTGGFTDLLLQRGAAKVYAIDVGYGQLAWKLRQDQRVVVMERTNARHLDSLPETIDLATIDASFISLKLILPSVVKWLKHPASVIALVKPQFEAGRSQVKKGGVVRDPEVHRQVLLKVMGYAAHLEFTIAGLLVSPVTGPAGNHEFLLHLGWQQLMAASIDTEQAIENCINKLHS
ncbi:MAG: TlyA family RNA methyltransferase [Anaerolineae bacterium]|nr:TlyA family RNA methyltransferase [Anaerolineae bacterium]